jgi:phosphoribosylformylglycinamidine synthase
VDFISCPVRHAEGQFIPRDSSVIAELEKKGMVAVKYASELLDDSAGYPSNPNGSAKNIAGICSANGKILGLMPHIECSVYRYQFPRFTAGISHEKASLRFFQNIVEEGKKHV